MISDRSTFMKWDKFISRLEQIFENPTFPSEVEADEMVGLFPEGTLDRLFDCANELYGPGYNIAVSWIVKDLSSAISGFCIDIVKVSENSEYWDSPVEFIMDKDQPWKDVVTEIESYITETLVKKWTKEIHSCLADATSANLLC